jgi:hypothetical protein
VRCAVAMLCAVHEVYAVRECGVEGALEGGRGGLVVGDFHGVRFEAGIGLDWVFVFI